MEIHLAPKASYYNWDEYCKEGRQVGWLLRFPDSIVNLAPVISQRSVGARNVQASVIQFPALPDTANLFIINH